MDEGQLGGQVGASRNMLRAYFITLISINTILAFLVTRRHGAGGVYFFTAFTIQVILFPLFFVGLFQIWPAFRNATARIKVYCWASVGSILVAIAQINRP